MYAAVEPQDVSSDMPIETEGTPSGIAPNLRDMISLSLFNLTASK